MEKRKILFVQPALASYRIDFFDRLHFLLGDRVTVYFSPGKLGALTQEVDKSWAKQVGVVRPVLNSLYWQDDVLNIDIKKGDILVLSGNARQLSTLALLVKGKLKGAKVVWWSHYWSSSSQRWRQILRFIPMSFADAILFYTDEEIKHFRDDPAALIKPKIVTSLNNGVDDSSVVKYRKPYQASERERALLFIGRLTKKANLELALRALAILGPKAPILHVIGDGDHASELKSLAENLNVKDYVCWHGAAINDRDISQVANKCKAFLYPGEVGLSLIHSMLYGLPSVVHNSRRLHMPEISAFKDGQTGCSFQCGSADSLATVLCALMDDNKKLDLLHANVVSVVADNYTTRTMAIRFKDLVCRI